METVLCWLEAYWDALVMMTAEMAPYLLLGFFVAGLLRTFVPRTVYSRHLSPRTMGSVAKAAAIGVPLPLCSCGVIPTAVSLRREGASHGACTSFLIATPQTGVDSIAATYSLMGLPFAVVRPIAALFTAIFGGWLVNRFAKDDEQISVKLAQEMCESCSSDCGDCDCGHDHEHEHGCSCHHEKIYTTTFKGKFLGALQYGFVEMLQDVGKWLVIGLLIAALITVAVPNEWLAALHEYKLLNMLIVLAVAIPMYVCATGSIPIAVSLMAKGLTPGAALVLLMAGPAVNSASMLVIGKVFGRRTFILYVVSIVIGAMLFGLGIDYLLPQDWFAVTGFAATAGEHCAHCLTVYDWLFIAAFLILLVHAFVALHSHHHHHHEEPIDELTSGQVDELTAPVLTRYGIKGMSCNHCKANVERTISAIPGVERAEVDLASGTAYVYGKHDTATLIEQVSAIGYKTELAS